VAQELPQWWYDALKSDDRGWGEKSLGELLGVPSNAEIRRNASRADRHARFAGAIAEHEAYKRLARISAGHAVRTKLPPAQLTDRDKLRREFERKATKGIRFWKRAARQAARHESAIQAEEAADKADAKARAERNDAQAKLTRSLRPLRDHEPDAVIESLRQLFKSFPHEVLAVGATEDGALVVVAVYDHVVPTVEPNYTPTGRLTSHKLKKSERNWLYCGLVATATINAARQALAAAPGAAEATCMTVRSKEGALEPVALLRLERGEDGDWNSDPSPIVALVRNGGQLNLSSSTMALRKLRVAQVGDLRGLVQPLKNGRVAFAASLNVGSALPSGHVVTLV
jgi:hypothetical protein